MGVNTISFVHLTKLLILSQHMHLTEVFSCSLAKLNFQSEYWFHLKTCHHNLLHMHLAQTWNIFVSRESPGNSTSLYIRNDTLWKRKQRRYMYWAKGALWTHIHGWQWRFGINYVTICKICLCSMDLLILLTENCNKPKWQHGIPEHVGQHVRVVDISFKHWPVGCNICQSSSLRHINMLRLRQNGRYFADDTFKCISNENGRFSIKTSWSLFLRVQLPIFQHWFW